jgi:hypothetical protein
MIYPLLNFTIKGAIWYQGESNIRDARLYTALMNAMITSWRKVWNVGEFPFYYVQIAPYNYEEPYAGVLLREAQLKCLAIPNTGMAVTMDIAENINDIHPKNKSEVGRRLALWSLNKTYNKKGESFSGPVYKGFQISGNRLIVEFNNADGGLKLANTKINNFTIAGVDHVFYQASVKIQGNSLVVSSPKVKQPQAARYAFTNKSEASFFNGNGLPASSFRTDNWDIITENALLEPYLDPAIKTLSYQLFTREREADIYYDFNKLPGKKSKRYLLPIPSGKPGTLFAVVSRNGFPSETTNNWKIVNNKAIGAEIIYKNSFSERFKVGGKLALLDGIVASDNFKDGSWQGFEGNDLDVVIDLGKTIQAKTILSNFLSDNNNWIFLPKQVSVMVSEDGKTYKSIGEWNLKSADEIKGAVIQPIMFQVNSKIRYIKLTAINQGTCPAWHQGAGNKCWMFVDEIILE